MAWEDVHCVIVWAFFRRVPTPGGRVEIKIQTASHSLPADGDGGQPVSGSSRLVSTGAPVRPTDQFIFIFGERRDGSSMCVRVGVNPRPGPPQSTPKAKKNSLFGGSLVAPHEGERGGGCLGVSVRIWQRVDRARNIMY